MANFIGTFRHVPGALYPLPYPLSAGRGGDRQPLPKPAQLVPQAAQVEANGRNPRRVEAMVESEAEKLAAVLQAREAPTGMTLKEFLEGIPPLEKRQVQVMVAAGVRHGASAS